MVGPALVDVQHAANVTSTPSGLRAGIFSKLPRQACVFFSDGFLWPSQLGRHGGQKDTSTRRNGVVTSCTRAAGCQLSDASLTRLDSRTLSALLAETTVLRLVYALAEYGGRPFFNTNAGNRLSRACRRLVYLLARAIRSSGGSSPIG